MLSTGSSAARTALLAMCVGVATTGCAGALGPTGTGADAAFQLTVLMTVLGTIVYLGVLVVLGRALWAQRIDDDPETSPRGRRMLLVGAIVVPAVVLPVVFAGNIAALVAQPDGADEVIEVHGHQFWWEVHYEGFTTANEIHIPAGRDVRLDLRGQDVIHSFWVPELSGKRDLIPGMPTSLVVHAEQPGTYRGQCAELCGIQHANMHLRVVAHPPEEYDAWLARWQDPDRPQLTGSAQEGYELFEELTCASCHAIAGTPYDGQLGPALTDLMTREEIGAGIIPLTRDNLRRWVRNAQDVKPGVEMPPIDVDDADLEALLDYLETLGP